MLTNLGGGIQTVMMHDAIDRVLGFHRTWSNREFIEATNGVEDRARDVAKAQLERDRKASVKPRLPLSEYAGTYASDLFGKLIVEEAGGALRFRLGPNCHASLFHWSGDRFRGPLRPAVFGRLVRVIRRGKRRRHHTHDCQCVSQGGDRDIQTVGVTSERVATSSPDALSNDRLAFLMETDAEGVSSARPQPADAMSHVDAIRPPRALDRAMVDGKYDALALAERDHLGPRRHAAAAR